MKYLLTLLVSVCWVGAVCADDGGTSSIDVSKAVAELVQDRGLSGVVLVTIDGETLVDQAFNIDPLGQAYDITADSAFTVASITKSFTACLVLDQVSRKRIDLDGTISRYLPQFRSSYADIVTVRQLLQNRSGIPHYTDIPGWFDPAVKGAFTPASFLAELAGLALKFPPGEEYYYSNANYYLLGLILEAVTDRPYEALLTERILQPLGLKRTGQIYSGDARDVAPTYLRNGERYDRIDITSKWLFKATASLYSTAEDLNTFANAVIAGSLLKPEMLELLLDEERPMGFSPATVPLGGEEVRVVSYNGELAGTTSMFTVFPEQRGTVVILANNNVPYRSLVELTLAVAALALVQE